MRIGTPLARLAELSRQYLRRSGELIKANQALLTAVQITRLQILEEARELAPTVSLAENDGFLRRADGQNYFYFSGESDYVAASGFFASFSPARPFNLSCLF